MTDTLFWYTGAVIWGTATIAAAIIAVAIVVTAGFKAHRITKQYIVLWIVGRMGMTGDDMIKLRKTVLRATNRVGRPTGVSTENFCKFLEVFHDELKKDQAQ